MNIIKNFNLQKLLKTVKLNESTISMVMGVIVVIVVGALVIKYFKNDRGSIPEELLNGANSVESANKTHKVEKGENLWRIAVKYYGDGFKWVDIATENKLSNAGVIEVGQELTIPNVENEKVTVTESASIEKVETKNTATNIDSITTNSYTVVKGDSLWKIAVRAYGDGYKWTEVAKENNLSHPNLIHIGNVITIPR